MTCQTPKRFIRVAWLSLQPKGDVSFGLADKTYISPRFKGRHFIWNAYNRVTAEYEVSSDPNSLEKVKNPHFTFHYPNYFHLKSDKDKSKDALFAGLCEVPIVLTQQDEMPWIRATTSPLNLFKSAGLGWSKVPQNDMPIILGSEDASIQIEVDFIRQQEHAPNSNQWIWYFTSKDAIIRVRASLTLPRISTLAWYHSY